MLRLQVNLMTTNMVSVASVQRVTRVSRPPYLKKAYRPFTMKYVNGTNALAQIMFKKYKSNPFDPKKEYKEQIFLKRGRAE